MWLLICLSEEIPKVKLPSLVLSIVLAIVLQWLCADSWADDNLSQGADSKSLANKNSVNKSQVLKYLKGYEWQLQADKLNQLGPGTDKALLEIAADRSEANFMRARAASALMLFQGEEVSTFYRNEIISLEGSSALRRQLVQNYCDAYWRTQPREVGAFVEPLLSESDVLLRTRSAKCLSRIDSVQSRKALSEYKESITDSWEMRAAGFVGQEIK